MMSAGLFHLAGNEESKTSRCGYEIHTLRVFWYTVCHVCESLLPREVAPEITNGRLEIWLEFDCRHADQSESDDAIDQAEL